MKCYADVQVNAYILGSGPPLLTVQAAYEHWGEAKIEERIRLWERALVEGGLHIGAREEISAIEGREAILFIGPSVGTAVEVWEVFWTWNVERQKDGTVIVVHPGREYYSLEEHISTLEMSLPAFTQAVTTANQARVTEYSGRIGVDESLPMLVTDANQLSAYYRAVGAYDHPDGPPAQPPPVPLSCERAVPDAAANPGLLADCKALALTKDVLRGTGTLDWSSSTPIGQWEGVTVGGTPKRVQALDLEEKGLTGTLPAELGQLTGLVNFDLSENTLRGPIPTSFGDLTNLRSLTIEYNQLDGAIPAELAQLTQLTNLSLTGNRLTGAVPAWLGNLTRLTGLDLAENRLTGGIPVELGRLSALGYLSLGGNNLSGAVPTQLGGLTSLQVLYLDGNDLTGGIPAELGKLTGLEVLSLGGNELTGGIPSVLGSLSKLEELSLRNNSLTGGIPAALGSLSNLEYLYLAGNTLTGCIPAGLRSVANNDLSRLNLSYCGS